MTKKELQKEIKKLENAIGIRGKLNDLACNEKQKQVECLQDTIRKLKKDYSHSLDMNERDVERIIALENVLALTWQKFSRRKNEEYYESARKFLKSIDDF